MLILLLVSCIDALANECQMKFFNINHKIESMIRIDDDEHSTNFFLSNEDDGENKKKFHQNPNYRED